MGRTQARRRPENDDACQFTDEEKMTYDCNTSVKTERQTKATAAANSVVSVVELGTAASDDTCMAVRFVTKSFLSSVQTDRNNNNNYNNNLSTLY